ncbi:Uncharacterised protein [Mycobacteroides abscessus subsp. abscessus]|nr:Uncharacterised protein [Mycobacteroides abscessus subsp. abscessus]
MQQIVGASVQPRAGDDVVACLRDVHDRQGRRRLSGGKQQRGHATFQGRDALLDDILGGVADAGVDVALFGQPEERRGVRGVVEDVGGGLVDRQGPRVGRRVGGLARVDLLGLERPLGGARLVRATICGGGIDIGHGALLG